MRFIVPWLVSIVSFVWPQGADAAVITARSPSLPDVLTAVQAANDGDTVNVPAGAASWTNTLNIDKRIQLIGAGVGQTIISGNVSGVRGGRLISVTLSKDRPLFRLSGFDFRNVTGTAAGIISFTGTTNASDNPLVLGCVSNFRFDHCSLTNFSGGMAASFRNIIGVVDHVTYSSAGDFCYVLHSNWLGGELGHGSWADDPYWGTNKFLYFEDCDFTNTLPNSAPYGFDAYEGARFVVRHCRFHNNTSVTGHGTETPQRSVKQIELDSNQFDFVNSKATRMAQMRGGSWLMHGNRFTNCWGGPGAHNYRMDYRYPKAAWGGFADGTNVWDRNDPGFVTTGAVSAISGNNMTLTNLNGVPADAGLSAGVSYVIRNMSKIDSNRRRYMTLISSVNGHVATVQGTGSGIAAGFTVGNSYEIRIVQRALDQVGSGKGLLLTGNLMYGGVNPATYPNNALEPCYAWDNINTTGGVGANKPIIFGNGGYNYMKIGRDIINGPKPGYTPYVYPHPLVSGAPAPAPTPTPTPTPTPSSSPRPSASPTPNPPTNLSVSPGS